MSSRLFGLHFLCFCLVGVAAGNNESFAQWFEATWDQLSGSIYVVATPSLLMILGSASVFWARVPTTLQACTQNFSAGLLISAIAGELFPFLNGTDPSRPPPNSEFMYYTSLSIGFGGGWLFMFGLGYLTGADEENDGTSTWADAAPLKELENDLEEPLVPQAQTQEVLKHFHSEIAVIEREVQQMEKSINDGSRDRVDEICHTLMYQVDRAKRQLLIREPLDPLNVARMKVHFKEITEQCEALKGHSSVSDAFEDLMHFERGIEHIHDHAERTKFQRWKPEDAPPDEAELSEKISWPLVFCVTLDAAVDGLLIGLAYSANAAAGWSMSVATCLEMCFLGLSFAASLRNTTRSKWKLASLVLLPPFMLMFTGILGHFLGDMVANNPSAFLSFVAFSVVALLYLVTGELLAEAREAADDYGIINLMFFVGVFSGVVLERLFSTF